MPTTLDVIARENGFGRWPALRLAANLHALDFGGTLLSTIIHESGNSPDRARRDHPGGLRLALDHGVALPQQTIAFAGNST